MKSQADPIKDKLNEVSGDVSDTWRMAQTLLHDKQKAVFDDAECAKLVSTFSQFFIDKVNRIRDNITAALQSSARLVFATRSYSGLDVSSFQPVTVDEVRCLLSAMP